ncbi:uncharacterized protein LOC100899406 [Galendromus occidentalis]|uniref:Uncharacterized protein LOC100899406 n=1 Tax=Galendromus occidentalis TaxID=34638 RepID=A0AAJ6QQC5_9ACAR|nr:uncharacterized protein LOC100899406 [Galendromus occidentalis]
MQSRTKCREPRPVVVNVMQEHHSDSVNYLPRCTILHRCDAEAGCCERGRSCAWNTREHVDLYFYAIPTDTNRTENQIVKLIFTNHTSCACKEDVEFNEVEDEKNSEDLTGQDDDDEEIGSKPCPPPFSRRVLSELQQTCDCFDGEDECIRIKMGSRRLDPADKWELTNAVRRGEYDPPACYTGSFETQTGLCPRACKEGSVYNLRKRRCVENHRTKRRRFGRNHSRRHLAPSRHSERK